MSTIQENEVRERLENFKELVKEIMTIKGELTPISIAGGLTQVSAEVDLVALEKEVNAAEAEIDRLVGRKKLPGKIGMSLPYDFPNFLMAFHVLPAYLAGYEVEIHFASTMKGLGKVWKRTIKKKGIEELYINQEMTGEQFGRYCISNKEIRHFIIAGGDKIVDFYKQHDNHEKFSRMFIFGPTRPKHLLFDSADLGKLEEIVQNSMFSSGQICALTKEYITTPGIYEKAKEGLVEQFQRVEYGSPEKTVGPIMDKPAFTKLVHIIEERVKKRPDKYRILVGGEIYKDRQLVQPTLIEALDGVEPDIDGFGPFAFLNRAGSSADSIIQRVKEDTRHGDYAYLLTRNPIEAFKYEGLLIPRCNMVRINTDIMSGSLSWPYGGYNDSFVYIYTDPAGVQRIRHGKIFLTTELTTPA